MSRTINLPDGGHVIQTDISSFEYYEFQFNKDGTLTGTWYQNMADPNLSHRIA